MCESSYPVLFAFGTSQSALTFSDLRSRGEMKTYASVKFYARSVCRFKKTIKIKMIQEIGKKFDKIREIEIRYVNKKVIRFVNKQQSWVIENVVGVISNSCSFDSLRKIHSTKDYRGLPINHLKLTALELIRESQTNVDQSESSLLMTSWWRQMNCT